MALRNDTVNIMSARRKYVYEKPYCPVEAALPQAQI